MGSLWEKKKFQFKHNIRQIKSVFLFCESENEFQTVAFLSDNSIQMKTFKQKGESYELGETIYSDTFLRETLLEEDERPWHVQKFNKKFFIFKLGRQEEAETRAYFELYADGKLIKHVIEKAENFFFKMYFENQNQIEMEKKKEAIMKNEEGKIEDLFFNKETMIILLETNDGKQKIIKYENNEKKTLAEENIKTFVVSKDGQCVVIICDKIIKVIQKTQVRNYPVKTLPNSDFVAFDLKGDENSGYTFVLATDKIIYIFQTTKKGSALIEKNKLSRKVYTLCMSDNCNVLYVVENDGNNNFQLEVFKNLIY